PASARFARYNRPAPVLKEPPLQVESLSAVRTLLGSETHEGATKLRLKRSGSSRVLSVNVTVWPSNVLCHPPLPCSGSGVNVWHPVFPVHALSVWSTGLNAGKAAGAVFAGNRAMRQP